MKLKTENIWNLRENVYYSYGSKVSGGCGVEVCGKNADRIIYLLVKLNVAATKKLNVLLDNKIIFL